MNDKILNILQERDLHCVLNKFCYESLNIRTKTIYHEKSIKNKGKSEWLHPDMVGFQLTTSNWDSNITNVCKDFYVSKAILYSFELKKSITIDTLREYYFQAVSNSSWSNEGYLVAASLEEENAELISEIKRLVGAFGIGIIKLDILNPKNSSILFPAKRKDIVDGETMNKLYSINPDYQSYIQDVANSLQINQLVGMQWDDIREYNKITDKIKEFNNVSKKEMIEVNKLNSSNIDTKQVIPNAVTNKIEDFKHDFIDENINKIILDSKNPQLRYTKPVKCIINNTIYEAKDWANLLFKISMDFKNINNDYFKKYKEISRFYSEVEKSGYTYYHEELNLYVNPLSINDKYKEIQKLLSIYGIDLSKCIIYYELKNNVELKISTTDNIAGNMVTLDAESIDLNFTKPVKLIIENKVYTNNTWSSLIFDIASDLNKHDSSLFKLYVKDSKWCTEIKIWKDAKYSEELDVYVGGLSAGSTYKELQKLLKVYNINLNKCILYYEEKNKK